MLNFSKDEFPDQLTEVVKEHQPTAYFTAIAGELASYILSTMPRKSVMVVYGALSIENISYNPFDLIFKCHDISYFWLPMWIQSLTKEEMKKWTQTISDDISKGGEVFGTKIGKTFKLSEFEDAIMYARKHGSEGKTIIRPQE